MISDAMACLDSATSAMRALACVAPSPFPAIITGVGAVLATVVTYMGGAYWVQGRALKLKTTRLQWLRQSLCGGKHVKCPALLNELEFQLAYGYRYDENEIAFATARLNPSQILHDIRYAKSYVRFDATRDAYTASGSEQRKFWNLDRRIKLAGAMAFSLWMLIGVGLVSLFFFPIGAALLIVECGVGFVLLIDLVRGLTSAQRLCALTPDRVRPKRKTPNVKAPERHALASPMHEAKRTQSSP
ncbi:MAG: hypothetical protein JF606_05845 [Burkholderiales bacterium]|nr:hypothetical protein [Burkholderiales bacterium]